ncbi:condensation domain-containing protein [Streptosporangium sp. NPDC004631]
MLTVEFSGLTDGLGPFTWAQTYMWNMIHRAEAGTRSQFNIGAFITIPEDVSFERVSEVFLALIERHENLRTVYEIDADGGLRQRVMGSGKVEIDVIHRPDSFSAESEECRSLFVQLYGEEFDLGSTWPYRASLVCRAGAPAFLMVIFSHLTTDGFGSFLFEREFRTLLSPGKAPKNNSVAFRQLEIAAYQQSPDGQARNTRTIKYWEEVLRRYYGSEQSRRRHGDSIDGTRTISMVSPRLASSASVAARRYTTTPSTLLLAAATFAYATVAEQSGMIIEIACANRSGAWAKSCGNLFQFGVAEFTLDGADFTSTVRNAERSARAAYANSQYNPLDSEQLKRSVSGDLDPYFDLPSIPFVVNDIVGWCLPVAGSGLPLDRLDHMSPTFGEFGDIEPGATGYAFYLGYHPAPTGVRLGLEFDTAMLTRREAVNCLLAIDHLILGASRSDLSFREAQDIVRRSVPHDRP